MRRYDPYFVEKAKPIAQRVIYPFSLVYDMVLMGLTDEEIETLCRAGASTDLPVRRLVVNPGVMPNDMYDLAYAYLLAKAPMVLESLKKVADRCDDSP